MNSYPFLLQSQHSGSAEWRLEAVFDRTFAFYLWHSLRQLDLVDDEVLAQIWQATTTSICAADGACVLRLRDRAVLQEMVAVPSTFPMPASMGTESITMIGDACWATITFPVKPLLLLLHYFVSATLHYHGTLGDSKSMVEVPSIMEQVQPSLKQVPPHPAGCQAKQQALEECSGYQELGDPNAIVIDDISRVPTGHRTILLRSALLLTKLITLSRAVTADSLASKDMAATLWRTLTAVADQLLVHDGEQGCANADICHPPCSDQGDECPVYGCLHSNPVDLVDGSVIKRLP